MINTVDQKASLESVQEIPGRGDDGRLAATAYPHPLDAIVLAGTHRNPKRLISGQNKAFLEIGGRPLVRHVVDALLDAKQIDQVFVVGPVEQLGPALRGVSPRVHMVRQQGKMLTNTWAAIYASEDRHAGRKEEHVHRRPLLIISSDLPLVSGAAVDDFILRCAALDPSKHEPVSMLVGVVDEPGVRPFYPDQENDGIKRPYVELEFGRVRLANIYVARPRHLAHQEFLQTGFTFRKAVDWRNVVKLAFNVLKQPGGWGAAWMTLRMQLALMLSRGRGRLYRKLKAGNTRSRVEKAVGDVLGGTIRIVRTPFGGLSLDVDDEQDYEVLKDRYEDWIAIHHATPNLAGEAGSAGGPDEA